MMALRNQAARVEDEIVESTQKRVQLAPGMERLTLDSCDRALLLTA